MVCIARLTCAWTCGSVNNYENKYFKYVVIATSSGSSYSYTWMNKHTHAQFTYGLCRAIISPFHQEISLSDSNHKNVYVLLYGKMHRNFTWKYFRRGEKLSKKVRISVKLFHLYIAMNMNENHEQYVVVCTLSGVRWIALETVAMPTEPYLMNK